MAILLLVRHAETTWVVEDRLEGSADAPITDRGLRQAAALAAGISDLPLSSVRSSTLQRAVDTARLLGRGEPHQDARWREADLGAWTGRTAGELQVSDPAAFQAWQLGDVAPPEGEPLEPFRARVTAAVGDLDDGTHLVVAHGGVIRAVLYALLGLHARYVVPVGPTGVVALEVGSPPRLLAYNLPPEQLASVVDAQPGAS